MLYVCFIKKIYITVNSMNTVYKRMLKQTILLIGCHFHFDSRKEKENWLLCQLHLHLDSSIARQWHLTSVLISEDSYLKTVFRYYAYVRIKWDNLPVYFIAYISMTYFFNIIKRITIAIKSLRYWIGFFINYLC